MNIREDSKLSEADGIWWRDPWWEDSMWSEQTGLSIEYIKERVEKLKQYLTPDWVKKAIRIKAAPDIVTRLLWIRGLEPLGFLLHLSDLINDLETTSGFKRKINELASEKSESVLFEMETAMIFKKSDCGIKFIKESKNKSPDFFVKVGGQEIAVECKRLNTQAWERWAHLVTSEILSQANSLLPSSDLAIDIFMDKRFVDIYMDKKPCFSQKFGELLVKETKNTVNKLIGSSKIPSEINIGGIVRVSIFKKSEKSYGQLSGYEVSMYAKTRRLLENGVLRALEQLPNSSPGIISIYADFLPHPNLLGLAFDALLKSEESKDLVAILVFPRLTIFQDEPGCLFFNRETRWEDLNKEIEEKIMKYGNLRLIN
jgi:hypothetical protein